MFIFNVKELYDSLKSTVENNFTFVIVKGKVVHYKIDKNGHLYLTLQDIEEKEQFTINCCCWKFRKEKLKLDINKNNLSNKIVIIKGYISVYRVQATIRLIVFDITIDEISNIQALNYQKEQYLREQGYFNEENKKPLSKWPNIIGLITSINGEAYTDFITSLSQRFPTKVLFYNTATQGNKSSLEIIQAIKYFNNLSSSHQPKIIVITRGGGSFEDLQHFNEENLIQAIYESSIPIVTAIGHTNDVSFADYTADKYTSTPTKAAEIIAPISLNSYKNNLKYLTQLFIKKSSEKINYYRMQNELLNIKMPDCSKIINNTQNKVNELNKINTLLLKDCYFKYKKFLKDTQNQLEYFSLNSTKEKRKLFIILHESFINKAENCIRNQKNNFKLLENIFISIPFNINNNKEQLKFIKILLQNQSSMFIKEKFNNYYFLNKALRSLSYKSTLRRGYAIIKEQDSENIITRASSLTNKDSFEIIFYDKIIKISKR